MASERNQYAQDPEADDRGEGLDDGGLGAPHRHLRFLARIVRDAEYWRLQEHPACADEQGRLSNPAAHARYDQQAWGAYAGAGLQQPLEADRRVGGVGVVETCRLPVARVGNGRQGRDLAASGAAFLAVHEVDQSCRRH